MDEYCKVIIKSHWFSSTVYFDFGDGMLRESSTNDGQMSIDSTHWSNEHVCTSWDFRCNNRTYTNVSPKFTNGIWVLKFPKQNGSRLRSVLNAYLTFNGDPVLQILCKKDNNVFDIHWDPRHFDYIEMMEIITWMVGTVRRAIARGL